MTAADKSAVKAASAPSRRFGKRPATRCIAAVLFLAATASGGYALWRAVRPDVLASPRYVVAAENVIVTPPPKWIRSDVKSEVVRDITLAGPISILDEDLGERFYEAFAAHPWVAKVERILKRPPAAVEVELLYRRPVLMVQVPDGLLPVDAEGVQLLTADFSALEARQYPRLIDVGPATPPPAGTRWNDARVVAAARLASALLDAWNELGLHHLAPTVEPTAAGQLEFDLFTEAGTRVAWGAVTDDPAALADKLARLRHYYAERGTLEGARGPQDLDLRSPHGVQTSPRAAKQSTRRG